MNSHQRAMKRTRLTEEARCLCMNLIENMNQGRSVVGISVRLKSTVDRYNRLTEPHAGKRRS